MSRINIALLFVGLIAISAVLAPRARAQDRPAQMFVGKVDGTDAFIGLATDGDGVIAYVCDGVSGSIADFFQGSVQDAADGQLTLTTEDSGALLVLTADATSLPALISAGDSLTGSYQTPEGIKHYFRAEPAKGPGALYRTDESPAEGIQAEGGWIVLNDGQIRGQFNMEVAGERMTMNMSLSANRVPSMMSPFDTPLLFSLDTATSMMNTMATVPIPQPFNLSAALIQQQAHAQQNTVLMQNTLVVDRVNPMNNLCFVPGFC